MTPNKRKYHFVRENRRGGIRASVQLNPARSSDDGSVIITSDGFDPEDNYQYLDLNLKIRDCYRSVELNFGIPCGEQFSEQEFQDRLHKIDLLRQGLDILEDRLQKSRAHSSKVRASDS